MRKTNYPRTARVKASKIAAQNEMRELLNSIVTHSVKIAQIRQSHKRFQNIFENRLIKKEENFILKDTNFTGRIYPTNNDNLKWTFISKTLGKLITVENTGEIKLYDFNTQNHNIYTINNEEDEVKLLSVELFEHEPTAECKLLLLYQDLTFLFYQEQHFPHLSVLHYNFGLKILKHYLNRLIKQITLLVYNSA